MNLAGLSSDEGDALKELANIGMGRAAFALNQLLKLEVGLSIPELYVLPVSGLRTLLGEPGTVVIRQPFSEAFDGEVLALFSGASRALFAPMIQDISDEELLLEVTNILAAAFLGSLAEQLKRTVTFLPPSVLSGSEQFLHLTELQEMRWQEALIVDVGMNREEQTALCKLLLVFPDSGFAAIRAALAQVLSS